MESQVRSGQGSAELIYAKVDSDGVSQINVHCHLLLLPDFHPP